VIQSVLGIYHTKNNGVKDDFLGHQALKKNLVLFFLRPLIGVQAVSLHSNFNEVPQCIFLIIILSL